MTRPRLPGIRAWAWKCDFGLCKWAESERAVLEQHDKPSPEAVPVLVRLIEETELQKLISRTEILDKVLTAIGH